MIFRGDRLANKLPHLKKHEKINSRIEPQHLLDDMANETGVEPVLFKGITEMALYDELTITVFSPICLFVRPCPTYCAIFSSRSLNP